MWKPNHGAEFEPSPICESPWIVVSPKTLVSFLNMTRYFGSTLSKKNICNSGCNSAYIWIRIYCLQSRGKQPMSREKHKICVINDCESQLCRKIVTPKQGLPKHPNTCVDNNFLLLGLGKRLDDDNPQFSQLEPNRPTCWMWSADSWAIINPTNNHDEPAHPWTKPCGFQHLRLFRDAPSIPT